MPQNHCVESTKSDKKHSPNKVEKVSKTSKIVGLGKFRGLIMNHMNVSSNVLIGYDLSDTILEF